MRDLTHIVTGLCCGVVAMGFDSEPSAVGWMALAVGSVLPDIDTKTSFAGRYVPFISALIQRRFGHRTITHSLLGIALFALASSFLLWLSPTAYPWLILGYASHVILDSFNIQGVPLLYPVRIEFVAWYNRDYRIGYGSPREMTLLAILSIFSLALVPVASAGFSHWFHRALGSPGSACEDFLRWRDKNEVFLDVDGDNTILREAPQGRLRVLDALSPNSLLVEDQSGTAYNVVGGAGASEGNIWGWHFVVDKGKPITVKKYVLNLSGRSLHDIIAAVPKDATRCYINARLEIRGEFDHVPLLGSFERVSKQKSVIVMQSARPQDIKPYSHLGVEDGSAMIRLEYAQGSGSGLKEFTPQRMPQTIKLAINSLNGLVIKEGDEIAEGQRIARNIDQVAIEQKESQLNLLAEKKLRLQKLTKLQDAEHKKRIQQLRSKLTKCQRERDKSRILYAQRAIAKIRLSDAENALKQADLEILTALTDHTTKKQQHSNALAEFGDQAKQLKTEISLAKESQWLKSPLTGTVTKVEVKDVQPSKVSLEVTVLVGE